MSEDAVTKVLIALGQLEVRLGQRISALEVKVDERTTRGQGTVRTYGPPAGAGAISSALVHVLYRALS